MTRARPTYFFFLFLQLLFLHTAELCGPGETGLSETCAACRAVTLKTSCVCHTEIPDPNFSLEITPKCQIQLGNNSQISSRVFAPLKPPKSQIPGRVFVLLTISNRVLLHKQTILNSPKSPIPNPRSKSRVCHIPKSHSRTSHNLHRVFPQCTLPNR